MSINSSAIYIGISLLVQLFFVCCLFVITFVCIDGSASYAVSYGGFIAWLSNFYFAKNLFVFTIFETPQKVLNRLYIVEIIKWGLVSFALIAVFILMPSLDFRLVLLGFSLVVLFGGFAPIFVTFITRKNRF